MAGSARYGTGPAGPRLIRTAVMVLLSFSCKRAAIENIGNATPWGRMIRVKAEPAFAAVGRKRSRVSNARCGSIVLLPGPRKTCCKGSQC